MRRILLGTSAALGSMAVPASAAADEIAAEINVGCFGGGGRFESNGVVGDRLCAKVVVNSGGPWVPRLETNHINVHLTFDLTADDGSTATVLVTTKWTGDVLREILAGGTVALEGRGHVIKASGSLAGLDDDGGQFDAVGLVDYGSGKANWSFTHAVDELTVTRPGATFDDHPRVNGFGHPRRGVVTDIIRIRCPARTLRSMSGHVGGMSLRSLLLRRSHARSDGSLNRADWCGSADVAFAAWPVS